MADEEDFDELFSDEPDAKAEPAKAEKPADDAPQDKAQDEPQKEPVEAPGEGDGEAKDPPQEVKAEEPQRQKVDPEQFKGYLDEREKRQRADAEVERLKRELAQIQQQSQRKEEPAPDIYENPEGYQQHIQTQYQRELQNQKVSQSEFLARREFGDEMFETVDNWLRTDGGQYVQQLLQHPSPYHAAVDLYRKEQAASQLKAHDFDIEKLVQARLAQMQGQQPNPAPAAQQPTPEAKPQAKMPPQVANSGGAARSQPQMTEGDFFESVFET